MYTLYYRNGSQGIFKSLFHSTPMPCTKLDQAHQFVVVGGGAGGLAVGWWIRRRFGENSLAIIDPADVRETLNHLFTYIF